MPTSPFINLEIVNMTFCQHAILSTCHFVNMSFCQHVILSISHFANMPFYQQVILSTCQLVKMPLWKHAISPTCHFVNLPICQCPKVWPSKLARYNLGIFSFLKYKNILKRDKHSSLFTLSVNDEEDSIEVRLFWGKWLTKNEGQKVKINFVTFQVFFPISSWPNFPSTSIRIWYSHNLILN